MNDDESDQAEGDTKAFSSDDEFAAVETSKTDKNSSGGSDMFDDLKAVETPPKKAPGKRKLAPKASASSAKRPKSVVVDSDSDSDFGPKVN